MPNFILVKVRMRHQSMCVAITRWITVTYPNIVFLHINIKIKAVCIHMKDNICRSYHVKD